MKTRRQAKLAQAIKEVVSSQILFQLKDPRINNVTVIAVDVAADVRTAKVYVSVMGTPSEQRLSLAGLQSSRGYLQGKIADRLQTKNTPVLTFKLDQGVKKSVSTAQILREVLPEGSGDEEGDPDAEASDDGTESASVSAESTESGAETPDDLDRNDDSDPDRTTDSAK